ncbi:hypothetical protein [Streptomyces marianii]|uniref:Uncharacterized protein n=1 Tax=Streptomyces marianii TaxID=1817406 RepID=A0A5R9DWV4_9ACTN|nr:hypothetical protein [Streptomyces marianii]TLQ42070.1 hypothetical protein FEF34_01285 [Streptomyces marianii]
MWWTAATVEQLRSTVLPGAADLRTVRGARKDLGHAGLVEPVGKTSRTGAGGRPVSLHRWNLSTAGLAARAGWAARWGRWVGRRGRLLGPAPRMRRR